MSIIYKKGRKLTYDSVDTLIEKEFDGYNIVVRAPGARHSFLESMLLLKGSQPYIFPFPFICT